MHGATIKIITCTYFHLYETQLLTYGANTWPRHADYIRQLQHTSPLNVQRAYSTCVVIKCNTINMFCLHVWKAYGVLSPNLRVTNSEKLAFIVQDCAKVTDGDGLLLVFPLSDIKV